MEWRSRRRTALGADSGAGWLLAELSLILMIVMVGSELPPPSVASPNPPSASASPTPSKPTPRPGLANDPRNFSASLSDGPAKAAKSLAGQIKKARIKPGLVLLWGIGTAVTGPEKSGDVKAKLAPLLKKYGAPIRAYYKGPSAKRRPGRIYAEVFYLNE